MEVSQFLPSINQYGAISNFVLELRKILVALGYDSFVYSEHIGSGLPSLVKPYRSYQNQKGNVIILHGSIRSKVNDFFRGVRAKKMLVYYSPTPARFFEGFSDFYVQLLEECAAELKRLGEGTQVQCGISEFSQQELKQMGFPRAQVLPVITNIERLQRPRGKLMKKVNDGRTNILFTGRIVPNKKVEDAIRVFYYYQRFINANSRLVLVGTVKECPEYVGALKDFVKKLGLSDVVFAGETTDDVLAAYYRTAHVFLTMSEHEAFCVPLIEAMHFQIPIVAYASTAVPFTLRGSGVLVKEKDPRMIAELVDTMVTDNIARSKVLASQDKVLPYFSREHIAMIFARMLAPLLSSRG